MKQVSWVRQLWNSEVSSLLKSLWYRWLRKSSTQTGPLHSKIGQGVSKCQMNVSLKLPGERDPWEIGVERKVFLEEVAMNQALGVVEFLKEWQFLDTPSFERYPPRIWAGSDCFTPRGQQKHCSVMLEAVSQAAVQLLTHYGHTSGCCQVRSSTTLTPSLRPYWGHHL